MPLVRRLMIVTLLGLTLLGARAEAEEAHRIVVVIRGMVCSFCAQGLTKTFRAEPGVRGVEVSLEKKTVVLELAAAGAPDEARIRVLVEDSGFDFVRIEPMR
jgi:copper chaperone CopZ